MEKEILFADLDGTLIQTITDNPFPQGIWDMHIRLKVLDAIKLLKPKRIYIVSNQGGIGLGYVSNRSFRIKIDYIATAIQEYTGIRTKYAYCTANNPDDRNRKPNVGMLENILADDDCEKVGKEKMLMIGDASGKEGDFSDSDKRTAENFGIDYLDIEDFVKEMRDELARKRAEKE